MNADTLPPRPRTALQLWQEAVEAHGQLGTGRHGHGYEALVPAGTAVVYPDGTVGEWSSSYRFLDPVLTVQEPIVLDCGYNWYRAAAAAHRLVERSAHKVAVVWLTHGQAVHGPSYVVLVGELVSW